MSIDDICASMHLFHGKWLSKCQVSGSAGVRQRRCHATQLSGNAAVRQRRCRAAKCVKCAECQAAQVPGVRGVRRCMWMASEVSFGAGVWGVRWRRYQVCRMSSKTCVSTVNGSCRRAAVTANKQPCQSLFQTTASTPIHIKHKIRQKSASTAAKFGTLVLGGRLLGDIWVNHVLHMWITVKCCRFRLMLHQKRGR